MRVLGGQLCQRFAGIFLVVHAQQRIGDTQKRHLAGRRFLRALVGFVKIGRRLLVLALGALGARQKELRIGQAWAVAVGQNLSGCGCGRSVVAAGEGGVAIISAVR